MAFALRLQSTAAFAATPPTTNHDKAKRWRRRIERLLAAATDEGLEGVALAVALIVLLLVVTVVLQRSAVAALMRNLAGVALQT
jgi:hypothetical protein